jgi:hypothetical protein
VLLPADVRRTVDRYLARADGALPGRIVGCYVVGSTALGAYAPGRSDIDVVVVVDRGLSAAELRALRRLQLRTGLATGAAALARGCLAMPGTLNGVFVRADDLTLPVTRIVPVASQTGVAFSTGEGFDVNPVIWKVLAERGIAVRGPAPDTLGLQPEPDALRAWTLANLRSYWRQWGEATRAVTRQARLQPRWATAWGVLGAPRLHCTIATGEVISKEQAGRYAREAFDAAWHPLVDEALAYRRGEPDTGAFRSRAERARMTGDFVVHVVDSLAAERP